MSSWTQIVVKGSVVECATSLAAHCISPARAYVVPREFNQWRGHTHALVPNTPEVRARLTAWFAEQNSPEPTGFAFPIGTLLWFGDFVGPSVKSLRRVTDYASLAEPLSKHLSEI